MHAADAVTVAVQVAREAILADGHQVFDALWVPQWLLGRIIVEHTKVHIIVGLCGERVVCHHRLLCVHDVRRRLSDKVAVPGLVHPWVVEDALVWAESALASIFQEVAVLIGTRRALARFARRRTPSTTATSASTTSTPAAFSALFTTSGDAESVILGSSGSTFSEVVDLPGRGVVKQALFRGDEGEAVFLLQDRLDVVELMEQAGQQLGQHAGLVETWGYGLQCLAVGNHQGAPL